MKNILNFKINALFHLNNIHSKIEIESNYINILYFDIK